MNGTVISRASRNVSTVSTISTVSSGVGSAAMARAGDAGRAAVCLPAPATVAALAAPDPAPPAPWHAGEVAMQRIEGVAERMESVGRKVIRPYMPDQHRGFFAQLPFAVLGAVDGNGDAWATLRSGAPGFMQSPDPQTLVLGLPPVPEDPADAGLGDGAAVGLLGMELHTRRRNRMNGVMRRGHDGSARIDVQQSFGNCPQYIQLRDFQLTNSAPAPAQWLSALDDAATRLVRQADSFYVASYADVPGAQRQVDVSHRGGRPGFVRVGNDGALTVPEFAGNLFFNTLGNFVVNPRAGLVFVDFDTGDLLQMSGDVQLLDSLPGRALQGAQRYWRFVPRQVVWRRQALGLRWTMPEEGMSAAAARTGTWAG